MHYLAIVSLIWAFSFGLIGNSLSGVDPIFVAAARLGIASLVFLPFLRLSVVPEGSCLRLMICGGLQFGIMYLCYIKAFQYIPSHLVALFSVLTPIYVLLIHDLREARFNRKFLYASVLSIIGAAIIRLEPEVSGSVWKGFLLMQFASLSFGFGQVEYRKWKRGKPRIKDHEVFALLLVGGFVVAGAASAFLTDRSSVQINADQCRVLLYLGLVASGIGFFLWNKGAALCRTGTLAAFNNAVVPLAMACSIFIFGELDEVTAITLVRLLLGALCITGAVLLAEYTPVNDGQYLKD